jgi:hypothetical protein
MSSALNLHIEMGFYSFGRHHRYNNDGSSSSAAQVAAATTTEGRQQA